MRDGQSYPCILEMKGVHQPYKPERLEDNMNRIKREKAGKIPKTLIAASIAYDASSGQCATNAYGKGKVGHNLKHSCLRRL